jgi:hypothetical protein
LQLSSPSMASAGMMRASSTPLKTS